MTEMELWSIREVATYLEITTDAARRQLSRWGVKATAYERVPTGRVEGRYSADEVRAKRSSRPGQGARTDLKRAEDPGAGPAA